MSTTLLDRARSQEGWKGRVLDPYSMSGKDASEAKHSNLTNSYYLSAFIAI